MKQLIIDSSNTPDTIYTIIEANFYQVDLSIGRYILQESESFFLTRPGTENDRFELGYR